MDKSVPEPCRVCLRPGAKRCGKCRRAHYCGKLHQSQDWAFHKAFCVADQGMAKDDDLRGKMVPLAPLLKALGCTACSEVTKPPFKLCRTGHLVCSVCTKKSPKCPTCKAAYSMDSPFCVKNLMDALPKTCRHSEHGCTEALTKEMINEHETFCGFRPVANIIEHNFPSMSSQRETLLAGRAKQYFSKLKVPSRITYNGQWGVLMFPLIKKVASSVTWCFNDFFEQFRLVFPIFAHSTIFKLDVSKDEYGLELAFEGYFVGKPKNEVFIRLKFKKQNIESTFTLRAALDHEASRGSKVNVASSYIDELATGGILGFDFEIYTTPCATENEK